MQVKFLKAGKGDAILVKSKGKNMLIDGGDDTTYLLKELDEIFNNNECIDILVITHHDSDHIKGIIGFLVELKKKRFGVPKDFVKQVYFNSPRIIKGTSIPKESKYLSYQQASEIEILINFLGLKWDTILLDSSPIIQLGDVKFTCLSPTEDIVDGYANNSGAFLSADEGSDWNKSLTDLERHVVDKSLDTRMPNQSSIVLQLEYNKKRSLLTGDVTPRRLESILLKLYEENDNKLIPFDFIKLPHHGSHRNITKDIISKISCNKYVICTDGNNHFLPDKKTLLKVIKYQEVKGNKVSFLFNYSETLEKLRITDIEKRKYNIVLEPNNSTNGYSLPAI
ncbi:ComEC/Rec2 family competence protein [Saccharicrinis fermentans]|uniref:ComEC family competence protein n=1 Tax=Saccharicrinis fermentans DSM 9555 = JCM 21142 TaxID=869213 RepID=W7Y639_9BACT|nr:MBL fold metallo-hydrolase [Saccharicrinis fermentans]GAF03617.1 ComEC family competence protein [Saccharicrinis fermentans DSM 9555 = JCM 21142]